MLSVILIGSRVDMERLVTQSLIRVCGKDSLGYVKMIEV